MITRMIFDNEDSWMGFRSGRFTASRISELLADGKGKYGLSVGAVSYILETIADEYGEPKHKFLNSSMEWGKEQEPLAVYRLAEHLKTSVVDPDFIYTSVGGFVFFDLDGYAGGTPDVITPDFIAEIKCPDTKTHVKYKLFVNEDNFAKELPEYYAQCQFNMLLCEKKDCLFMSYDPRMKDESAQVHYIHVVYDQEFQDKILKKLTAAKTYRAELIKLL